MICCFNIYCLDSGNKEQKTPGERLWKKIVKCNHQCQCNIQHLTSNSNKAYKPISRPRIWLCLFPHKTIKTNQRATVNFLFASNDFIAFLPLGRRHQLLYRCNQEKVLRESKERDRQPAAKKQLKT